MSRPQSAPNPVMGWILSLSILALGLGGALLYQLSHRPTSLEKLGAALGDPEVGREVVARLVERSPGLYDTHSDPDVGVVLYPDLRQRGEGGVSIDSNRFGLRERDYAIPRAEDTLRIVLLGDGWVFGPAVATEQRMGAVLEEALRERLPAWPGEIEVLHVAMTGWNIRAECSYLLRQLHDLRPDVVLHFVRPDDLDDAPGVQGYGTLADFSPARRGWASTRLTRSHPRRWGYDEPNALVDGLDHESLERLRDAADRVERLCRAVEEQGGQYQLLIAGDEVLDVGLDHLRRGLEPRQISLVPDLAAQDPVYRLSPDDPHLTAEDHRRLGMLLYGLLRDRRLLLPRVELAHWAEAEQVLVELFTAGARKLGERREAAPQRLDRLRDRLDLRDIRVETARQIHGGLEPGGDCGPYASLVLRRNEGRRVRITGRALPDRRLRDAALRVLVEGEEVGEHRLQPGEPFELLVDLPERALRREALTVAFACDDYVYALPDLRRCVSARIETVGMVE